MATLRHLPQSLFRRSPWKNGGGETVEVAVWPEGAGFDDFIWRISMARVAQSGPFSRFSGIDRTLCVLEGREIMLEFEGRGRIGLDAVSPPYHFPADIAVSGQVQGGGITDLNVMTRRGAARHLVSKLRLGEEERRIEPLGHRLVVLAPGVDVLLRLGHESARLRAGDAALIEPLDDHIPILLAKTPGEVFIIDLWD